MPDEAIIVWVAYPEFAKSMLSGRQVQISFRMIVIFYLHCFFFVQSDDEKRLIFIVSLLGRLNVPCYERISKLSIQQPPTTKRTNLFSFLHCIITCVHLESHKGANRIVNKPVYVFLSFLVEKYHSTYFACKITNYVSKWSPWASPECFCRFSSYPAKI